MQQREQPPPRNPKVALTRFVAFVLAAAGFYAAGAWGWPGAWFVAALMGLGALGAFFDVLRAHQAWKTRNDLLEKAQTPGDRYTTRRDGGRQRPDNWQ